MKKTVLKNAILTLSILIGLSQFANAAHLGSKLTFSARMNGAQEVPAVTTNAAGVASMILNGDRDSLCISIYMGGFGSALQGVHLHDGAAGSNGPVLVDLSSSIVNGNIQFVLTGSALTPTIIQKMIEGNIYVNAHTTNNPNGEIRGQVKLEQDFGYRSLLNGANEVPSVSTNATGLGLFNLSFNEKKMYIWIVASGLSGPITGAHLHQAAAGANGPVAVDLTSNVNGNTIIDTIDVTLFSGLLNDLKQGNVYINIHTAANPNGEIRAQLNLAVNKVTFDAFLNGAQEVPAVATNATGTSYFSLNSTFTSMDYEVQVNGLSGPITGAHLHLGGPTANGPVEVDLTSNVNGNRISGTISGMALSQTLIEAMLSSGVYINIHTAANPNGEIRGNINRLGREGYTIRMDGAQEVPAVTTNAVGGGIVTISRERDNAHVMLVAKDLSAPISGAHIHNGMPGTNGPVVIDLTPFFSGNAAFTGAFTYLTREDATPFGPNEELLFRNGSAYINLHNMTHMNGEIRGDSYRGSLCFTQSNVGLNEIDENSNIRLYPNPVATTLNIQLDKIDNTNSIVITDAYGKIIQTIDNLDYNLEVNVSDYKAGIYFLKSGNVSTRFIKQ